MNKRMNPEILATILRLNRRGVRPFEIAKTVDVSRQRVHQVLVEHQVLVPYKSNVKARREKVALLYKQGLRGPEIVKLTDRSLHTIYSDLRHMGINPSEERSRKVRDRRKKVRAMFQNGASADAIARKLRCTIGVVHDDIKQLKLA